MLNAQPILPIGNNHGSDRNNRPEWQAIKAQVHQKLLDTMNLSEARQLPPEKLQVECARRVEMLLAEQKCPLTGSDKQLLIQQVMDEIFGLGPLEKLLEDKLVSDILVNGPHKVYIEKQGRLELTNAKFRDDNHLMQLIQRIASNIGRRIDENSPMLDARLADGSRINAIIPPLSVDGPSMSIRRFGTIKIDVETLIGVGAMTPEIAQFLQACVNARLNILISGGTGSGKTTLLNVLSKWIPEGHRVVTIEDVTELQIQRDHVVRLEARQANIEGRGEVTSRDLLRNALRMRPDRIIIGEVRGAEALDMLQAMNTGHEGSMTTIHANNLRDATRRVENMVSMAGLNYPVAAIRQQFSSAINIMVQLSRLTGGPRKVVQIGEVTGMEGDQVCLQDIFRFRQTGVGDDGKAAGHFESCGVRPMVLNRILAEGMDLPAELFQRRVLGGAAATLAAK